MAKKKISTPEALLQRSRTAKDAVLGNPLSFSGIAAAREGTEELLKSIKGMEKLVLEVTLAAHTPSEITVTQGLRTTQRFRSLPNITTTLADEVVPIPLRPGDKFELQCSWPFRRGHPVAEIDETEQGEMPLSPMVGSVSSISGMETLVLRRRSIVVTHKVKVTVQPNPTVLKLVEMLTAGSFPPEVVFREAVHKATGVKMVAAMFRDVPSDGVIAVAHLSHANRLTNDKSRAAEFVGNCHGHGWWKSRTFVNKGDEFCVWSSDVNRGVTATAVTLTLKWGEGHLDLQLPVVNIVGNSQAKAG